MCGMVKLLMICASLVVPTAAKAEVSINDNNNNNNNQQTTGIFFF